MSTVITGNLTFRDRLGAASVRTGINRYGYRVQPGLYELNEPDPTSPVFVSANYKLSFDILRRSLKDISCRLLVLDTRGINVWCAAGKGTFGTDEIVRLVDETGLKDVVNHRRLIVPQLGAPGVQAHIVRRKTGFNIVFGPVEASDIPDFIANGLKKNDGMRTKSFGLTDRLVLTPVELVQSWKLFLPVAAACFLLTFFVEGIGGVRLTVTFLPALLGAIAGGFLTPAALPWLPGRAFAMKGAVAGALMLLLWYISAAPPVYILVFNGGLSIAVSSFVAMNFTGASTYTSLSGVRKEMKYAVPLQIAVAAASLVAGILIPVLKGGAV